MYSPGLGRFISRDSIGYNGGGYGLYGAYFAPNFMDPMGLEPCTCDCDPGQADVSGDINKMIQDVIDAAVAGGAKAQGDIRKAIEAGLIGGGGGFLTGIEAKVKAAVDAGTLKGKKCPPKKGFGQAYVYVVCGQCIGSDKLGHFLEEGLAYLDISNDPKLGEAFAKAFGYWAEGLAPPGMTPDIYKWLTTGSTTLNFAGRSVTVPNGSVYGAYGDQAPVVGLLDPNGSASPADLAANEAGLTFWRDLMGAPVGGFKVDICKYVNKDWNHTKGNNPNIPGVPRPGPPAAKP